MLALPCTNQSSPKNSGQTTYNEDNVYTFFSSLDEETACSGEMNVGEALMSKVQCPMHVQKYRKPVTFEVIHRGFEFSALCHKSQALICRRL